MDVGRWLDKDLLVEIVLVLKKLANQLS